jgi:hypothetical protein
MAQRAVESVRRGVSGLGVRGVRKDVAKVAARGVDAGGVMGGIEIVEAVRRCRLARRVL